MTPTRTLSIAAVFATLAALLAIDTSAANSTVTGDELSPIAVTAKSGDVAVTVAGTPRDVQVGSAVELPARIVTGSDGMLGLSQAQTSITVAAGSDVEIPAEAADGQLVARLIQHRGNVFYDVAHREAGRLRVETPLLVAVIKGTQFNVTVLDDSTVISLFEGRLEIQTPDGDDIIQLDAGEIAIRSLIDDAIRVVGMDDNRAPAARDATQRASDTVARNAPNSSPAQSGATLRVSANSATVEVASPPSAPSASLDLASNIDAGETTRVGASTDVGDTKTILAVDTSTETLDVGLGTTADAGDITVEGKSGIDAVRVEADLGAEADLALDSASVDLEARLDLGRESVDTGVATSVDLGAGSVDVGLETGVDLGSNTVDVGLDTGIDLGSSTVDVGLDTGIDLGSSTIDVGLDTGIDLGSNTVDVGLDTGIDLGTDLDLPLDLPTGGAPPPSGGRVGGLLGGLL